MNVLIVFCHPSKKSFTHKVYKEFCRGLSDAGHEVVISDLYDMNFRTDLSEEEYMRETYYNSNQPLAKDVILEQEKVQAADSIVFIYPVFWTEAPAKLVGWFDRVWTTGFAYSPNPTMKVLEKALFIACAGKSAESLVQTGEANAMRTVMLNDRIRERAKKKEMVILDGITHWDEVISNIKAPEHYKLAYELGHSF